MDSIKNTLRFMESEKGLVLPYGIVPEGVEYTEGGWDEYQWNPPIVDNDLTLALDPNVSEKPTWKTLLLMEDEIVKLEEDVDFIILRGVRASGSIKAWVKEERDRQIESIRIPLSSGIFKGGKPEHMVNLIAMCSPGMDFFPVMLKDEDGVLVTLTDRQEMVTYFSILVPEVNRLHNAEEVATHSVEESAERVVGEGVPKWERVAYANKIISLNRKKEEVFKDFFSKDFFSRDVRL